MTEEGSKLALEILRDICASQERTEQHIGHIKVSLSSIEHLLGRQQMHIAAANERLDRMDARIGRMERRLELIGA